MEAKQKYANIKEKKQSAIDGVLFLRPMATPILVMKTAIILDNREFVIANPIPNEAPTVTKINQFIALRASFEKGCQTLP